MWFPLCFSLSPFLSLSLAYSCSLTYSHIFLPFDVSVWLDKRLVNFPIHKNFTQNFWVSIKFSARHFCLAWLSKYFYKSFATRKTMIELILFIRQTKTNKFGFTRARTRREKRHNAWHRVCQLRNVSLFFSQNCVCSLQSNEWASILTSCWHSSMNIFDIKTQTDGNMHELSYIWNRVWVTKICFFFVIIGGGRSHCFEYNFPIDCCRLTCYKYRFAWIFNLCNDNNQFYWHRFCNSFVCFVLCFQTTVDWFVSIFK